MNLLYDSLSADLAAQGRELDEVIHQRFLILADCAVSTGAEAMLFTNSAFGSCIEAVAQQHARLPVLRPNETMLVDAAARGGRIGLVASFAPTLASMPAEFPADLALDTELAAAQRLQARGSDCIAQVQFSMVWAAPAVERKLDLPVLTTPKSAVQALRHRLQA